MTTNKGLNIQKCEIDIYKKYRGRWSGKDKFSVLIRCRNEERWIGHCIQSVIDHLDKPEIIVVDNNSNDDTLNIINHFIEDPKLNSKNNKKYTDIKIFNITNYSPGKSLNLGIKKAKYENILILSAHCVLKKISTKNLVKDLKDYEQFLVIKFHCGMERKFQKDIFGVILLIKG